MLQLIEQPDPEKMFHDHYAFYSSTSSFMAQHFKQFASQVLQSGYLAKDDPFVVELGCNDGIMLKNFAEQGIRHLGIEPSLNVAQEANKHGVRTRSEFFSETLAESIVREDGQADAFLAANVMCHIPDIVDAQISQTASSTQLLEFRPFRDQKRETSKRLFFRPSFRWFVVTNRSCEIFPQVS